MTSPTRAEVQAVVDFPLVDPWECTYCGRMVYGGCFDPKSIEVTTYGPPDNLDPVSHINQPPHPPTIDITLLRECECTWWGPISFRMEGLTAVELVSMFGPPQSKKV